MVVRNSYDMILVLYGSQVQTNGRKHMKLTIVGATGGIGRLLLEQAVAAGHEVTAVVRNPANLTRPIRAVKVDLSQPDRVALESAMAGADAVLSGLGPRSRA